MRKLLICLIIPWFFAACKTYQSGVSSQVETSTQSMVSAAHPLAMQAGKRMLQKGGNAVDAAVATAFTLAVVEPSMSGLGGRLQAIVRLPNGEIKGVDATTQIPLDFDYETAPKGRYGYPVIGIPGVVAGLLKLWEDHGTLPLKTIMAPAIYHAAKGFNIQPGEARMHSMAVKELKEFEGSRQYYISEDGDTYQAGELLVQKDLANTLKLIAKGGRDAFYKGEIAEKIAADHAKHNGALNMEALAQYEAKTSTIVTGNYRGYDLHGLWIPSFGAITVQIMQILESLPMEELEGAEWASAMHQAISIAYEDRGKQLEAADMAQKLTDKSYAKERAKRIDIYGDNKSMGVLEGGPESWYESMGHTTHLSAADENGMMVGLTQSLGPIMGSKVAAPGLGFVYATTIGEYLRMKNPGQRASSHISPFLLTKDGKPFMAVGAAGGSRIVSAIAAVCSRVIDHNMSLEDALGAARVHPLANDTISVETHAGLGKPIADIRMLETYGFPVKRIDQKSRFGRVHAVMYDAVNKQWIGAADPDWEGAAGGPEEK